jgi:hypothetical protein
MTAGTVTGIATIGIGTATDGTTATADGTTTMITATGAGSTITRLLPEQN